MNASIRTYEDLIQDSRNPGKMLVEAAAVGFDGNLSALARSIGMSLRSLMYLKSGGVASSQASRMLLAVLANNPNGARRICESANSWMDTNGLVLTSRVGDGRLRSQGPRPMTFETEPPFKRRTSE